MSKPSRKRNADTYESDGFVVNDDSNRSTDSKVKKSKHFSSAKNTSAAKGAKKEPTVEMQIDEQGSEYWEISKNRRVQISEFNKQIMVNIREFYEKDGKMLPGKKGISLTMPQYALLIQVLPDIERVLDGRGESVPRPEYDGGGDGKGGNDVPEASGVSEAAKPARHEATEEKGKKNFEATSDEDEEGG